MPRRAASCGSARQGAFDNFNIVVAGVKGQIEGGIWLIYETLDEPALDEVSTAYGLLAEAMRHPEDFSSVDLSAAGRGALAGRQAGDARGRDLLVRVLQDQLARNYAFY